MKTSVITMATDMIAGTTAPDTSDWMDALLRSDARNDYIDDAGFTARVMQQVPVAAQAPAWRAPAVAALWGLAIVVAFFALPGMLHEITRDAYRLFTAQPLSLPMMVAMIVGIATAMWTVAAYTLRVR